jgi:hypothetical protein
MKQFTTYLLFFLALFFGIVILADRLSSLGLFEGMAGNPKKEMITPKVEANTTMEKAKKEEKPDKKKKDKTAEKKKVTANVTTGKTPTYDF